MVEFNVITAQNRNKLILKNTLLLYFRMMVTMFVAFFTSRVVLNTLGIVDFGIHNVVAGAVSMFTVLNSTLSSGTQRFLAIQLGRGDFVELKKTFSLSLLMHVGLAFTIFFLLETVGYWVFLNKLNIPLERISAARTVFHWTVVSLMMVVIRVPYNAMIIAHEQMSAFAYISVLETVLKLFIAYLLSIAEFDKLVIYGVLLAFIDVIMTAIYWLYCKIHFVESKFVFIWDRALFMAIAKFSGWNLFGSSAAMFATQGVNMLLNVFFGPAVNAARGIACQINAGITGFVTNFQLAVNPQIFKLFSTGQTKAMNDLLIQNAKYSFCLLWLFALPLILETDVVLYYWLKNVPELSPIFCRLIVFQSLIYCVDRPFVMAVHATGNMKEINLTAGLALLCVLPLSYLLLANNMPPYYPFVVHILITPLCLAIEVFYLRKWIKMSAKKLFREVIATITLFVLFSSAVPIMTFALFRPGLMRLFAIVIVSAISTIICAYNIILDTTTKQLFKKKVLGTFHGEL